MARRKKEILVSWLPTTHGAAPLLTLLTNPGSMLRGLVDELVLCYRDPPVEVEHTEVLDKTLRQLARLPPELSPKVTLEAWRSRAAPSNHAALLDFSKDVLTRIRQREPEARINIQLSSGTKAMHAIWLTLAHGSFIPGEVRLLQTAEERHQQRGAKPVELVQLPQETWAHIVRHSRPTTEVEGSDPELWDLSWIRSASAKTTLQTIERWAPMPAPIFLIGERGTGKTTLAQTIRARSAFRALDKPGRDARAATWPVVVCGQFRANPQLARSELFGHTKGAFTGADAERKGILEQVSGDTLFLDEIADLDRGTQRLLIGAIEGRDYYRLGNETRPLKANFRLIVATNRPLESLVLGPETEETATGIDADFFDRISTFILRIPPLRERREDLPHLWASVLQAAARRAGLDADATTQVEHDRAVLAELEHQPLPGNIRDLQRAAWRAVAAIAAHTSRAEVAREAIAGLSVVVPTRTTARSVHLPIDLDAHLDEETRRLAEAALLEAHGNKSEAARLLGLPRKTFESKLKRLGG